MKITMKVIVPEAFGSMFSWFFYVSIQLGGHLNDDQNEEGLCIIDDRNPDIFSDWLWIRK